MYIYGASGHGRVIIDMIDSYEKIHGVFDDDVSKKRILGHPVLGPIPHNFYFDHELFIAVGDNRVRKRLVEKLKNRAKFATVIHDSCILSRRTAIGSGCAIMEGTIIKTGTNIGDHSIINTGASIDHDCIIDSFVHIAPQATLCGGITIGKGSLVGANSVILPGCTIGKWCKIGAGSVVHKNIPDYGTWIGKSLIRMRSPNGGIVV